MMVQFSMLEMGNMIYDKRLSKSSTKNNSNILVFHNNITPTNKSGVSFYR
jgi:hypothetical protein